MESRSPRSLSRGSLAVVAGTLVLLIVAPDVDLGPYGAVNPQRLARIVAAVLAIGGVGYVAQRALGHRDGLVLSGFVAGFVSSTATIAAMGARAQKEPALLRAAVAAATASNIATVIEYFVIVAAVDPGLVGALAPPLGVALVVSIAVTATFARNAPVTAHVEKDEPSFNAAPALLVAVGSAVVSMAASALEDAIGQSGPVVASAIAGLVDAHSTSGALAAMKLTGRISASTAVLAIVVALSTNAVSKILMAALPGGRAFAVRVAGAVVALVAAAWLGFAGGLLL